MPTKKILKGPQFEIRAWVDDAGKCQVLEFLKKLEADGDSDWDRLNFLIDRLANSGITYNKKQMRELGNGIFEIKAPNTARIIFFYDANRLIICSHGFTGKKGKGNKSITRQIERALSIRQEYFRQKGERNG